MANTYSHILSTSDLANQLRDELEDLRGNDIIPDTVSNKKKDYSAILRAINRADLSICQTLKPKATVVVFFPSGGTEVVIGQTFYYPNRKKEIYLNNFNKDNYRFYFYLNDDRFLDIRSIDGYDIELFDSFPAVGDVPDQIIKKVDSVTFRNAPVYQNSLTGTTTQVLNFDPDMGIIRVNPAFGSDKLIRFKAFIQPGHFDASALTDTNRSTEDWTVYTIKTPDYAQNWLVAETMLKLLGASGGKAIDYYTAMSTKESLTVLTSKPSDTNYFSPDPSWS